MAPRVEGQVGRAHDPCDVCRAEFALVYNCEQRHYHRICRRCRRLWIEATDQTHVTVQPIRLPCLNTEADRTLVALAIQGEK